MICAAVANTAAGSIPCLTLSYTFKLNVWITLTLTISNYGHNKRCCGHQISGPYPAGVKTLAKPQFLWKRNLI